MQLKCLIKGDALVIGILALISITAVGQENRSEISIQGTGFFTKDTAGNGTFERASETGGFLLGYRYNVNRWLAAEANYGYDRNTQFYFGGTAARIQSNIHQITGAAVVKLPTFARLDQVTIPSETLLEFTLEQEVSIPKQRT
jgi:hypothetical protein